MSSPSSMPIPAGWYPDPAGSFQQRWWTGESWTNDFAQYRPTLVHSAPVVETIDQSAQPRSSSGASPTVNLAALQNGMQAASSMPTQTLIRDEPVAPVQASSYGLPAADQAPRTSVAQPNAGNAALIAVTPSYRSTIPTDTSFENEYQPFSVVPEVRRGHRLRPERRYTAAVWLLTVLPVALLGAAYAIASLLPVLYTTFTQVLLLIIFVVASVALAAGDRHVLYRDGHDSMASPALALLTPLAYLAARAVIVTRETGRTTVAPLLLLLALAAGIAGALLFVSGLLSLLLTATALY
jgi:hypothetical protein